MKALLITYPYCSLFRVIALLKAKQEGHPLEKDWLETTSIYIPDRSYLFQVYRAGKAEFQELQEPIIRTILKPISKKFLPKQEEPSPLPKTSFSSWNTPRVKPLETTEPVLPVSQPENTPTPSVPEIVQEKPVEKETKNVAASLAAKSVSQDDEIISETLAKIFAKQGKKDHAIDIYLKLSLKFPEKKAYFADQIENLTKKG